MPDRPMIAKHQPVKMKLPSDPNEDTGRSALKPATAMPAAPPARQLINDLVRVVEEAHRRGSELLRTQLKPKPAKEAKSDEER